MGVEGEVGKSTILIFPVQNYYVKTVFLDWRGLNDWLFQFDSPLPFLVVVL